MAERTSTATGADRAGGPAVHRRRFLRRAGTVFGVGLGITMAATPAWAPPSCVTKCTKGGVCYMCGGKTMYKCSCQGSAGYWRCENKCQDSFCRSTTRCV